MSSTQVENDTFQTLEKEYSRDSILQLCTPCVHAFQSIIKSFAYFHFAFFSLCIVELFFILLFFAFLAKTSILAVSLAILFLTLFSYFILRIYFNTKKPQQLLELKEDFLTSCKTRLHYQEGLSEHHLFIANACCKCASLMKGCEYGLYTLPERFSSLAPLMSKISCWMHWKDVQWMRNLLINAAIDEHIAFIKFEPTNLEAHASLASVYVLLSSLYSDPRKSSDYNPSLWVPPQRFSEEMHEKFVAAAERAMEEFKILNDYAPDDPWVHTQLAYSYRDLQMPLEEIREYETILKITPGDNEVLFKLGLLYFEQGFNAKGLQVYEELKRVHYKKAEALIHFYGSYSP